MGPFFFFFLRYSLHLRRVRACMSYLYETQTLSAHLNENAFMETPMEAPPKNQTLPVPQKAPL